MAGSYQYPPITQRNGKVYSLIYDSVNFSYTPIGKQGIHKIRNYNDFGKNNHAKNLHSSHTRNKCEKNARKNLSVWVDLFGWQSTVTNEECRREYKQKLFYGFDYRGYQIDGKYLHKVTGWKEILEAYSLPNEPIAISEYDLWRVLEKAADTYHASCKKTASIEAWGMLVFVVSAIATIASLGTLAPITIAGLSAFVGFLSTGIMWSIQSWREYKINEQQNKLEKLTAQKAEFEAKKLAQQRGQITNMLIYDSSSMFANGQAYNAQQAGSQSFSPSIAYDPNKALLGQQKMEFIDEFTQNRAQVNLAGGVNFINNLLEFDFPLASIEAIQKKDLIKAINQQCHEWQIRLNYCFLALTNNGFGVGFGKDDKTINNIIQRAIKYHITTRQKRIEQIDALDKLKNYNKGLRYECPMSLNTLSAQTTKNTNASNGSVSEWERNKKSYFLSIYKTEYNQWLNNADKSDNIKLGYEFYEFMLKMLKKISEFNSNNDKTIAQANVTHNYFEPLGKLDNYKNLRPIKKYFTFGKIIYNAGSFSLTFENSVFERVKNNEPPSIVWHFYSLFIGFSGKDNKNNLTYKNAVYAPAGLQWAKIDNYHYRNNEYISVLAEYEKIVAEYQNTALLLDVKIENIQTRIKNTQDKIQTLVDKTQQTQTELETLQNELKNTKDKTQKEILQEQIQEKEANLQEAQEQIITLENDLIKMQKRLEQYDKQDIIIFEMMEIGTLYKKAIDDYYFASEATAQQAQEMQELKIRFYEKDKEFKTLSKAQDEQESQNQSEITS